jgi:radical SAM superfamily enzyme YgiQ (UPF0313 family)/MoaA/NifB/PqqE/SkfB family radical SAM enzyme
MPTKILLANLPWGRNGVCGVRAGSRWPHIKDVTEGGYMPFPFYLAHSAALLKKNDFEVELCDALAEDIPRDRFIRNALMKDYELIIAETCTASLKNDLEILSCIKKENSIIAICGPEVSMRNPEFFEENRFIDCAMIGEYELTALELAGHIRSKMPFDNIQGIVYRDSKGKIRLNPPRPLISNLDELPWPTREGLPMSKYLDAPGDMPLPSVQMIASRGCPFQCLFCAWPQLMYGGNSYRVRSIKDVVDEMEFLVNKLNFKSVYFDDDTFNIGKNRMLQFADELISRNKENRINVPWAIMARADLMDEEILYKLRLAGLYAVKYGIESSDQNLLKNANKGMDIKNVEEMIRLTKKMGIKTHLSFTFGLPDETWYTILKTISFSMRQDPDSIQFSICTPFPGTRFYELVKKEKLLISQDPSDYDGNRKSVIKTAYLRPRDLEYARNLAYKVWKMHIKFRKVYNFFKSFRKKEKGKYRYSYLKIIVTSIRENKFSTTVSKLLKFLYPERLKGYYLEMLGIKDGQAAYKGPDFLHIDLTNKCNNDCIGCWCNSPLLGNKKIGEIDKNKTLSYDLLKDLIKEARNLGTRRVAFGGGGEPMMHPDFLSIINYAKMNGLECYVSTNFSLADREILDKLIRLRLAEVAVSVWAATEETYCLVHNNKTAETFRAIKDNLVYLNTKKNSHLKVKICNVITKLNFFELEKMFEFAIETKSDIVEFTVIDIVPDKTEHLLLNSHERKCVIKSCENIRKKLLVRNNKIKISNFDLFIRRISNPDSEYGIYDSDIVHRIPCYAGWTFSRVSANGDVNFCLKSHRLPVGNIYRDKFSNIWNSSLQGELRKKALLKKKDDFFRMVGNGDDAGRIGCERVCDDIVRNIYTHNKFMSLTLYEKMMLEILRKSYGKRFRR